MPWIIARRSDRALDGRVYFTGFDDPFEDQNGDERPGLRTSPFAADAAEFASLDEAAGAFWQVSQILCGYRLVNLANIH